MEKNLFGTFGRSLEKGAIVRGFLAISAISLSHFWAFVLGFPQNFAMFVDAIFFLQFQALFLGNVALTTMFLFLIQGVGLISRSALMVDPEKETKLYRTLYSPHWVIVGGLFWIWLFVAQYAGWRNLIRIELINILGFSAFILAIVLVDKAASAKRKRNESLDSDSNDQEIGARVQKYFLMILALCFMISWTLGSARSDMLTQLDQVQVRVGERSIVGNIIGLTSYGYIFHREDCGCINILSFAAVSVVEVGE
jgi:hypothetical protein